MPVAAIPVEVGIIREGAPEDAAYNVPEERPKLLLVPSPWPFDNRLGAFLDLGVYSFDFICIQLHRSGAPRVPLHVVRKWLRLCGHRDHLVAKDERHVRKNSV